MLRPSILVTGGAGFIGSHIVEYFVKRGESVRVLDNFSTGKKNNLEFEHSEGKRIEIVEGDISCFESVSAAMKGITEVFHEAAFVSAFLSIQQPRDSFRCNVLGTFNVFEAARLNNISKIVFASSAAVYGDNHAIPLKETHFGNPINPYALDKIYAENLASLYYRVYGLPSVGLRYFNVYGPRQRSSSSYSGVVSKFVDLLLVEKTPLIYGDGYQTRDFIYVSDVVGANIYSMRNFNKQGHYIFNVGTGESVSIRGILELSQRILGKYIQPAHLPALEEIRHSCADISYVYQQMEWKHEWKLEQGLLKYINFLKETRTS